MAVSWAIWLRSLRSVCMHVVVVSEVAEAGCWIGEQVPDNDQARAGNRDQGLESAAALDDTAVAFVEEGVGACGCSGRLPEPEPARPPPRWPIPPKALPTPRISWKISPACGVLADRRKRAVGLIGAGHVWPIASAWVMGSPPGWRKAGHGCTT